MTSVFFQNTMDYIRQGGWIVYPLAIVSIWMWYLIVSRIFFLTRFYRFLKNEAPFSFLMRKYGNIEIPVSDATETDRLVMTRRIEKDLNRQTGGIFVLASIAPLLGLLGTVTGMISTFETISRFGSTNARAFAAGISEALITTQLGLVIAVPGLFLGYFIKKRTDNIKLRIQRFLLTQTKTEPDKTQ
jgi:biopolymer transport protein ExbB